MPSDDVTNHSLSDLNLFTDGSTRSRTWIFLPFRSGYDGSIFRSVRLLLAVFKIGRNSAKSLLIIRMTQNYLSEYLCVRNYWFVGKMRDEARFLEIHHVAVFGVNNLLPGFVIVCNLGNMFSIVVNVVVSAGRVRHWGWITSPRNRRKSLARAPIGPLSLACVS